MNDQTPIQVALWSAADDNRAGDIAGALELEGLSVLDLDASLERPMLLLLLPGSGGAKFTSTCLHFIDSYPNLPIVILHSKDSEQTELAVGKRVFELLPSSVEASEVPRQIRSSLRRWTTFDQLKRQAKTLQQLESTTDLVYFDFRPDTGTFRPSVQLSRIIGTEAASEPGDPMQPTPLLDCIHSEDRALFASTLFEAARSAQPFCVPIRLTDADGNERHYRTRGRAFGPANEANASWVFGVCEDTTDHMRRLAEAEARSRIDELTGLGNRRHFDDCLSATLENAHRANEKFALLYIDLDRFKLINDTLGHDAGDELLRVISARLSEAVRVEDIVCHDSPRPQISSARVSRLGGDEFTVLLSGIHGPEDAEAIATRLLHSMRKSVEIGGQTLSPAASVGIALFPSDGQTPSNLRKRADAALYAAKAAGGGFRFFNQSMEDGAIRRLSLEHELRTALDRESLELHYQPRIDYRTGAVIGSEALLRWTSPTLGRIPPGEVFQIAEDTGLITSLGRWTLHRACQQALLWTSGQESPPRLSVNISPVQFEQDDVFTAVVDALMKTGFPPDLLDLEITEALLLRDDPSISQSLEELRRIGVRIVLDDFGKGYSALAVLMSQPIDVLKLDRRLIETVAPDGEGSPLLANVIRMAHDLGLHPIAEGVSHVDQAEFLSSIGCWEMQGYHFSAAIPPEAFREKQELI